MEIGLINPFKWSWIGTMISGLVLYLLDLADNPGAVVFILIMGVLFYAAAKSIHDIRVRRGGMYCLISCIELEIDPEELAKHGIKIPLE